MSNALALAGVTAVLRDLLDSGMIDHDVTDAMGQGVSVTAVAPDTVRIEGPDAKPQLNIFLHQATPNAALRNLGMPGRDRNGRRIVNAPLALDLHYLVTAYGVTDLQAEVLLGYAIQLLHETPILSRDAIRTALNPPNVPVDGTLLPAVYDALRASDLAEQYEQIKITPAPMNMEEMSKLWSAMQAHYRPTAAYQVSVVLLEATRPARAPLPVLTRGPSEVSAVDPPARRERGVAVLPRIGPTLPQVHAIEPPNEQTAAHLGDTVSLVGDLLDGSGHTLLLELPRLGISASVAPASSVAPGKVEIAIPNAPANLPAGTYLASLRLVRAGETTPRETQQLLLKIAPRITSLTSPPQQFARDADGTATVTVTCEPHVQPAQRAALLLGNLEIFADDHPNPTPNLTFTVRNAPVGTHHARLRVDGVDSQLVDRSVTPPVFLDHRIEIV